MTHRIQFSVWSLLNQFEAEHGTVLHFNFEKQKTRPKNNGFASFCYELGGHPERYPVVLIDGIDEQMLSATHIALFGAYLIRRAKAVAIPLVNDPNRYRIIWSSKEQGRPFELNTLMDQQGKILPAEDLDPADNHPRDLGEFVELEHETKIVQVLPFESDTPLGVCVTYVDATSAMPFENAFCEIARLYEEESFLEGRMIALCNANQTAGQYTVILTAPVCDTAPDGETLFMAMKIDKDGKTIE